MDKRSNNNQRQQRNRGSDSHDRYKYNKNDNHQGRQRAPPARHTTQPAQQASEPTPASSSNSSPQGLEAQARQELANNQSQPQAYIQNQADITAEELSNNVHSSVMRGIDSTYGIPISEHVLYSSYESYYNTMLNQRESLVKMMNKLTECSEPRQEVQRLYGSSATSQSGLYMQSHDYDRIESLKEKYDTIHDLNEVMFDKIGQNLDDAAGFTSRDAQLVKETLAAAKHNKMLGYTKAQPSYNRNMSSSSSSSSISKPTELISSSRELNNQTQQQYRYKKPQSKVVFNQVNSVVQSFPTQQARNQFGGYLGKQQYGPPNQRYAMLENKNIPRPQNQFKKAIDNSYRPFEPIIRIKPNAQVPLRLTIERDEHGNEYYLHPYDYEIQKFPINQELIVEIDNNEPPELVSTPIIWVDTIQELEDMCRHIESQKEFAVDVEHHSYRSFQGITCLLQISTRTRDYVIDAIKLRSELYRLNVSFTNSNIVKVFHGADCDILWLQRDFGVYVVNLFDTSRAAKLMKFAHLSLAFLMKHYCNVEPDKSYQLADWRERPLPLPMLQYARTDTHYLLYIYDMLRSDLLMKGGQNKSIGIDLLKNVFELGREICLKRYEKPPFSDTSHLSVLRKSRSTFNAKQMFAFKELYAWRDSISRELDESVGYVLPNNLMIRIAEYLPREPQGITALCNPVPPTVKKYLSDIHAVILKAIDVPLEETSKVMINNSLNVDPSLRSIDLDSVSHKQDIAHSAGMQESSVPNLLDKMHSLNCSNDEENSSSNGYKLHYSNGGYANMPPSRLYNFLDAAWSKSTYSRQNANVHESIQKQFNSPIYHRYCNKNN